MPLNHSSRDQRPGGRKGDRQMSRRATTDQTIISDEVRAAAEANLAEPMSAAAVIVVPSDAAQVQGDPERWRVRITEVVVAEPSGPCEHCADEFEDAHAYVAAAWVGPHWDPITSDRRVALACWEHCKTAVHKALDDSPEDSTIKVNVLVLGVPMDPATLPR